MIKPIMLQCCFKGERTYLQGADMMNHSLAHVRETLGADLSQLDFSIHRMTGANLILSLAATARAPVGLGNDVAIASFEAAGKSWQARLSDAESRPDCRYPYDEDVLIRRCSLDSQQRSILLEGETPYTPIETIVAMTKALHLTLFPRLEGSWAFCRWESPHWPLPPILGALSVRLVQALGTRLTKSQVWHEEAKIGEIYFSARQNQ